MKQIFSLYIARLNNKQHFSFIQLAVAACTLYSIISEEFRRLVEALRAAFQHENDVFVHLDRAAISKRLQDADDERIRLFRHMRDFIKTFETCSDAAKKATAEILLNIISTYGGGGITSMKVDERSAALFNLVEDFENVYPAQVEALGCTEMVSALKEANQEYIDIVAERAQFDAENGMAMMATARKRSDTAYKALVEAVNAAESVDTDGLFIPYIDYMNVNVRHYRMLIGQSLADMDGGTSSGSGTGSGEESVRVKNATFEFVGGDSIKRRVEVGTLLVFPDNTQGYVWRPLVKDGLMPNRNIVFREVPIDEAEATATFHFFDHREEEIRQLVGSVLNAPANTSGYVWDPTVPSTMPAEDTAYYELPIEDNDNGNYPPGYDPDADEDPGV